MGEIQVIDAVKKYREVNALDKVTLTIEEGKIYGLLGRNGAGKSTLIKAISNRIFLNEGSIFVDGENNVENEKALSKIFVMSEADDYPDYKVSEVFKWLKMYNSEFDIEFAEKLSGMFKLNLNKPMRTQSTGYKSITKFIASMSSNLPYIFLDEPVLGLDANHRALAYKIILETYAKYQPAIVVSTHLIEEIANMVEHVFIIKEGKIIEDSEVSDILEKGYSVSGKTSDVESYLIGKELLSRENLGGLTTAVVLGKMPAQKNAELEYSKMDLQSLFVKLTSSEEEKSL